MTLLSYKLNHKSIEKILTVDGKSMYEEALKQGVPFFKWNEWIEDQLDKVYWEQVYKKKSESSKSSSNDVRLLIT